MKDEHVKDAAQGVAEDVPQNVRRTWPSGPGGAPSSPRHATTAAAAVFVQLALALRYARNWAAQWHLARAVGGKRFRGYRAMHLYV